MNQRLIVSSAPASAMVLGLAGRNKLDHDPGEWKYAAKGTCSDLKGMTEDEAKAKAKKS